MTLLSGKSSVSGDSVNNYD